MLTSLQELLSIKSICENQTAQFPYGEGPAQALDYTLSLCQQLGFRTRNADYRYGYAEIGQGEKIIGILAHLDTVPAGSGWSYPPFAGTLAEGRLYGRGVQDDKGPVVACIYAMKALLDSGVPLPCRIRLILGQDEETGEWEDIKAYCREEELPACGFTPDGAFPAIFAEKGALLLCLAAPLAGSGFRCIKGGQAPNMVADCCQAELCTGEMISASGVTAHGSLPWEGKNAITSLMRDLALRLNAPVYAEAYMALVGDDFHGAGLGLRSVEDDVSGRVSVNAGHIETVGDHIRLYLDIRYPVTWQKEQVLTRVAQAVLPYGQSVECCYENPPLYIPEDSPLLCSLLEAYRQVTGDERPPIVIGGGSYARGMENIIAFGPGFPGKANTEHESNEYIEVDDLYRLKDIYHAALERLLHQLK